MKTTEIKNKQKTFSGKIVSTKMKDTVVVLIERYTKHPKYGKFLKRQKKFKAHDADNKHKEGEIVEKSFEFLNSGKVPLYILDVYGTCGCTVPEWPKDMIEPGRGGLIKVKFNSEGKTNEQRKLITVVANTFPVETLLYLDGIVTSKN